MPDKKIYECTLKDDQKDGTFVYYERRYHGKKFYLQDLAPGSLQVVESLCDVKISEDENIVPENIEPKTEKKSAEEMKLFAEECWDLAVKQSDEIIKLKAVNESLEDLNKSLRGECDELIQKMKEPETPETPAEEQDRPEEKKTRKRSAKKDK